MGVREKKMTKKRKEVVKKVAEKRDA